VICFVRLLRREREREREREEEEEEEMLDDFSLCNSP
jgi:hypothetical protein